MLINTPSPCVVGVWGEPESDVTQLPRAAVRAATRRSIAGNKRFGTIVRPAVTGRSTILMGAPGERIAVITRGASRMGREGTQGASEGVEHLCQRSRR